MDLSKLDLKNATHVTIVGDNATHIEHVEHFHPAGTFFDTASHPMARFVMRPEKAEAVINEMRHLVSSQPANSPKDVLAPLMAAMTCKPRAIMQHVTCEAFVKEFGVQVSEDSFKNWIKGYHDTRYEEGYLDDYEELFSDIMKS